MGMVFGKQTVAEPAFEVLFKQSSAFSYEIRRYGTRFAAQVSTVNNAEGGDGDRAPFSILAKYIGVFGDPQNEGVDGEDKQPTALAMTAPVIKTPTKLSMTAPVVKQQDQGKQGEMTMAFILPAEYDSISKIPKPTNPRVQIKEIKPAVGVAHCYSGSQSEELCMEKAKELAAQLRHDGLTEMTDEYALERHEFWGFNPPFTLPMFRRNEVWIELTEEQANQIVNCVDAKSAN